MALPEDFLNELRSRNDIVSVVSAYVQLRPRGRTHVGLCPFHGEKTPSFTVYPDTESFYCFGCQAGGDVISFIKKMENLDYIDAVELLANRSGLAMPENRYSRDTAKHELKMRIYEANREAGRFFYRSLYDARGKAGLDYLRENRRLTDATIRSFGLGFAPDSYSALTDYLVQEKRFTIKELVEANLTTQSKSGRYIDRFRNRVMFPIFDTKNNVIAFGGRIMTDEKPKYLNTADTPVYKKTNNLFALNRAKNSSQDKLILCEGYMDVIALYQAGFDNVVGGLGTALTEEQAKLLKRYSKNVVLCYDSDEAGQKAAMRAMQIFDKHGVNTFVIRVPEGKDPDEYIKRHGSNGYIKFKQLVEGSENEVEYFYHSLKTRYNTQTPDGKIAALNEAARFLASLSDPIKRDVYTGKICEDMQIKRDTLEMTINNELRRIRSREDAADERRARNMVRMTVDAVPPDMRASSRRAGKAEEMLVAFLIVRPEMVPDVSKKLSPESFSMPFTRRVYEFITERVLGGRNAGLSDIASELELSDEERAYLARMIAALNEQSSKLSSVLCGEYVSVILSEREKVSAQELSQRSDDEVESYLEALRAKKLKKQ